MTLTLAAVPGLDRQPTAVRRKLVAVADRNGWDADGMAAAIAHESTWRPAVVNPATGAAGLVQWTAQTARALGTSTDRIVRMGAEAQLDLAERFWKRAARGRPIAARDFLVLGIGTGHVPGGYRADLPDSTVLYPAGSPGALGNPNLQDETGAIRVGKMRAEVDRMIAGRGRLPVVAELDPIAGGTAGKVAAAAVGAELLFWGAVGALALWRLARSKRAPRGRRVARRRTRRG
jgi:hypothetical protein